MIIYADDFVDLGRFCKLNERVFWVQQIGADTADNRSSLGNETNVLLSFLCFRFSHFAETPRLRT